VILLVILGLLVLFMMILVSFVVTGNAERRGARAHGLAEQVGDPPDALLNQAILQVVRGTHNQRSVIGPHSLLEDMYGDRESISGFIAKPPGTANPITLLDWTSGTTTMSSTANGQIFQLVSFATDNASSPTGGLRSFGSDRAANNSTGGSILSATDSALHKMLLPAAGQSIGGVTIPSNYYPAEAEGYFAGCVLTILDGNLANQSTQIIRWFPANPTNSTASDWNMWIKPFNKSFALTDLQNVRFVINGRPFNGSGFGYSFQTVHTNATTTVTNSGKLNGTVLNNPYPTLTTSVTPGTPPFAMAPNPTDRTYRTTYLWDRPLGGKQPTNLLALANGVDADEDYDIPDVQNMLLAWTTWNPTATLSRNNAVPGRWEVRSPSLHRPELINYWCGGNPAQWTGLSPTLRQQISLRPDPAFHYLDGIPTVDFAGRTAPGSGTTGFDPINGPWDVDNDNDGVADSIWVDFGLPIQYTTDGRTLKPLVAVLCQDLDGRINLNAHGNPAQYRYVKPAELTGPSTTFSTRPFIVGLQGENQRNILSGTWSSPPAVPGDEINIVGSVGVAAGYGPSASRIVEHLFMQPSPNPAGVSSATTTYAGAPYAYYTNTGVFSGLINSSSNAFGTPVTVPTGLGMSVAEINLHPILAMSSPPSTYAPGPQSMANYILESPSRIAPPPANGFERFNRVRWVMEGRFEGLYPPGANTNSSTVYNAQTTQPNSTQRPPVPGRYGETSLINGVYLGGSVTPNSFNVTNPFTSGVVFHPPRAGMTGNTFFTDPTNGTSTVALGADDNFPPAPVSKLMPTQALSTTLLGHPLSFRGNAQAESSGPLFSFVSPGPTQMYGLYSTLPDPNGRLVVGLDLLGRPLYAGMSLPTTVNNPVVTGEIWNNEAFDDPWEIDLSNRRRHSINYPSGGPGTPGFGGGGSGVVSATNISTNQPAPYGPGAIPSGGGSTHGDYTTNIDAPFTPADLQLLLRPSDIDTMLDTGRMRQILFINASDDFRNRLTTESWDVPCPNLDPPPEIRDALAQMGLPTTNLSFAQLVMGKLAAVQYAAIASGAPLGAPTPNTLMPIAQRMVGINQVAFTTSPTTLLPGPVSRQAANGAYRQRLFSPDLLLGLRMDLNRPLGNGYDDNGNGVVDEPLETTGGLELLWTNLSTSTQANASFRQLAGSIFDADRNGSYTAATEDGHQELAKHLYCLMMLLTDINYVPPLSIAPAGATTPFVANQPYERNPAVGASNSMSIPSVFPSIQQVLLFIPAHQVQ
jgi:hypothetical protein